MIVENKLIIFNIRERFWKAWLIDMIIQKNSNIRALKKTIEITKLIDLIFKED